MSIESELAKRDRLLAEKSARIRELEAQVSRELMDAETIERQQEHIRELEAQLAERTCKQERLFNLIRRECDGEWYGWHGKENPNYCPNCGARVIGVGE